MLAVRRGQSLPTGKAISTALYGDEKGRRRTCSWYRFQPESRELRLKLNTAQLRNAVTASRVNKC